MLNVRAAKQANACRQLLTVKTHWWWLKVSAFSYWPAQIEKSFRFAVVWIYMFNIIVLECGNVQTEHTNNGWRVDFVAWVVCDISIDIMTLNCKLCWPTYGEHLILRIKNFSGVPLEHCHLAIRRSQLGSNMNLLLRVSKTGAPRQLKYIQVRWRGMCLFVPAMWQNQERPVLLVAYKCAHSLISY